MQDSENRTNIYNGQDAEAGQASSRRARRERAEAAKSVSKSTAELPEEDLILGDEEEIPLRRKKKPEKTEKKKRRRKKKSRKHTSKTPPLFSEKKFRRKKSIFEIMSPSGEESFIKPIHIFGHEIRFWPLFILAAVVILVAVIVMSNGNVSAVPEKITVVGLPADLENYQILVLSDLNGKRFGEEQSVLVRQVETQGYDLILCVGDMVGKGGDPEPFYEFLEGIDDPDCVYFVCGDADPGPYLDSPRQIQGTLEQIVYEDWILGAMERGAHYVATPTRLDVGQSRIWLSPNSFLNLNSATNMEEWKEQMRQEEDGVLSGLASDYNSLPFTSHRYALAQSYYNAINEMQPSDLIIGLSHIVPDDSFISSAATHDGEAGFMPEPELIVSGHYCGGVWQLPFAGPVYVPNRMLPRNGWFPASEDVSGLSKVSETQVFITNGLSTTSVIPVLPFRVFNDPEINVLTLTAKLPENMLEAGK